MPVHPMLALVLAELSRVPRGSRASPQNLYRMVFYAYRMNSLGKRPQVPRSPAAAHAQALRTTRSYYPGFTPNCT